MHRINRENRREYVEKAICLASDLHKREDISDDVFVIEECSELIKELMKKKRGLGNEEHIIEEACDVLTTVFTLLYSHGVDENTVAKNIILKVRKAQKKYFEKYSDHQSPVIFTFHQEKENNK